MPELDRWRIVDEPSEQMLRLMSMPMPRIDWSAGHSSWDPEVCKCAGFGCPICGADNRCESCQAGGYHDLCHQCAREGGFV